MIALTGPAMAPARDAHASLHATFRWQVPQRFNIAQACCGRWARQRRSERRVAIAWEHEDGGAITSSPALAAGRLVVGSTEGRVLCFR